jgi:hypothetical protein
MAYKCDLIRVVASPPIFIPGKRPRPLSDAVLRVAEPSLADDVTLLIIDRYGRRGQPRHSTGEPTRPWPADTTPDESA